MAFFNMEPSGEQMQHSGGMYYNFFHEGPSLDPRWPQNGEHGHEFFDPGHDIHVHGNQYPGPAGTFINGAVYFSNPDFDDSYSDRSDQSDPKSVESAIKEGKAVTIYTGQQVVILPDAVNAEKALASQNH